MKTLPAKSVQTCVTSPPYYGLRDYGTASWEGGDPDCEHTISHYSDNLKPNVDRPFRGDRSTCLKCGSERIDDQIGLEDTPEDYVAKLVKVFGEVKRLLRDDGTLWLNLGDSFWGGKGKSGYELPHEAAERRGLGETMQHGYNVPGYRDMRPTDGKHPVIKPKDLIGIPWMVAFALRADGWYLRSDIIWHKPNPMPESVTDRPTKSHEYIFLLSKSREYFYDADAIREPLTEATLQRDRTPRGRRQNGGGSEISLRGIEYTQELGNMQSNVAGRNRRSVWTVTTKPYSGAHFATFPTDLIEPCVLAGTSAHGCCAKCGAPRERIMEPDERVQAHWQGTTQDKALAAKGKHGATSVIETGSYQTYKTVGWQPTCNCNADIVPCTVLDPFNGSGTTGAVALKHGRKYIGCELNPDYIELAHKRIQQSQPTLFALEMSA